MPPPKHKPTFLKEGRYFTVKDLVERWGLSLEKVRRLINAGELRHEIHWHTFYIPEEDVLLLEEKRTKLLAGLPE